MLQSEEAITAAFGLPRPVDSLKLVQHTSFKTWRLQTESGDFLVKQLWGMDDPPWQPSIADAMTLEAEALAHGLPIARPVTPVRPAFGYAARIDDLGTVRLYDWVENRTVATSDDLTSWLGTAVATLHQLRPLPDDVQPEWRWWGVFPATRWAEWVRVGQQRGLRWAKPADRHLSFITELSERLRQTFGATADQVLSHGDIEPYNVLISADGPILIDWESVACESATLEIGRAALIFGGREIEQISRILQAYVDAGGQLAAIGEDLFLRSVSLQLCHIAERIGVMIDGETSPGWMEGEDLDARTADELAALPGMVDRLNRLARACAV